MDVRETGTSTDIGFGHEDHSLLHKQVRDPASGREGELMAVVRHTLGCVQGEQRTTLTSYIRSPGGREFTAAVVTLEEA
ncbi:hypothetical protein ACIRP0_07690 [Streptomyces sp. NPDC101733]|uniref:hypothetical protein n=1 Tax=unclassified Streptomyces TaxID=2593676 RepID=UPI0037FDE94E